MAASVNLQETQFKTNSRQSRARAYIGDLAASEHPNATVSCRAMPERRSACPPAQPGSPRTASRGGRKSRSRLGSFYVIVPPENRSLGCLPADQFVSALMERLNQCYFVGLLSAAQYHGAAHHRPQEFQVVLERARRPISCGRVRAAFVVRKRLHEVLVQGFNTPRGRVRVSMPEATACDLAGYCRRVAGLDQVATALFELAEKLDPERLAEALRAVQLFWRRDLDN